MTVASGIYVARREEEAKIRQQVEKVRADGRSRAVLLHGPGGSGKTMLVRHLAERLRLGSSDLVWVDPIDVDDSEYWLLSNLETAVAEALGREHFTQYFQHLGRIARFAHEYVSYETVLAQLSRINRTFVDCYRTYVQTVEDHRRPHLGHDRGDPQHVPAAHAHPVDEGAAAHPLHPVRPASGRARARRSPP